MNSNAVRIERQKLQFDEARSLSYVLLRSSTNHDLWTSADGRRSEDELMKRHSSGTRLGAPIY